MKNLLILLLIVAACKNEPEQQVPDINFDLTGQWVSDTVEYSIGIRHLVILTPKTNSRYDYTFIRSGNVGLINMVHYKAIPVTILSETSIMLDNKQFNKK